MILLDGREYNVATPAENAASVVAYINNYCQAADIRNSKDEVVQIEANWANPLYVILYGLCYLVSQVQSLVYSAASALSIPSSSDRQLLNLADIAHLHRKAATKTTIVGTVYSTLTGTAPCRITKDLSMTVPTSEGNVIFHPAFDVSVPINSSHTIILIAETYGSFSIPAQDAASFDSNPSNFRTMTLDASSPGQQQETIADLRMRLQRRIDTGTMQDKAISAIEDLDGVSLCNIYFNPSLETSIQVMGIDVPPRKALLFIQGWSDDIAETFLRYMTCEVTGADAPTAIIQTYTSQSGQVFNIPIIPAESLSLYIRVYVNQIVDDDTKQQMRDAIAALAQKRTIGQQLTSAEVINALKEKFNSYAVAGCEVSRDDISYSYQIQPSPYQLVTFDNAKIQIVSQES